MATKVLNLDEILITDARELVLAGVTYKVTEMSVQDYIEATKAAQKLKDNVDTEIQMSETARLISRQVTGITTDYLMTLSIDKLFAIAEFVRGVDPATIIRKATEAVAAEAALINPEEVPVVTGEPVPGNA